MFDRILEIKGLLNLDGNLEPAESAPLDDTLVSCVVSPTGGEEHSVVRSIISTRDHLTRIVVSRAREDNRIQLQPMGDYLATFVNQDTPHVVVFDNGTRFNDQGLTVDHLV
jgi:hypothetical protein